MIIDFISIIISFFITFLYVVAPRSPSILLLIFIIIYFIICWWHNYIYTMKDVYMTTLPQYLANKNNSIIINKSISNADLFITVFLFVIVILLSTF